MTSVGQHQASIEQVLTVNVSAEDVELCMKEKDVVDEDTWQCRIVNCASVYFCSSTVCVGAVVYK